MKKAITYLVIRVSFGLAIFLLANYCYKALFWVDDTNEFNPTLDNLFVNEPTADILYFGESSNFHLEHPKTKKVRISDYIDSFLTQHEVNPVDNAGLEASNYLYIMKNLPEQTQVKALVVTMNLRSFGYTWILDGNYNYHRRANEFAELRPPLINRFFVALKAYDHIPESERVALLTKHKNQDPIHWPFSLSYHTLSEWNHSLQNRDWTGHSTYSKQEALSMASHYVKNFAFSLNTEENPRINDFDQIVMFASQRNIPLVFHLLSENIEQAEKMVGEEMSWLLRQNAQTLVNRYHDGKNVWVVNNLETVPDAMFVDRHFPIEHYSNLGKKMCAQNIVDTLRGIPSLFEIEFSH